jgi:CRP/FNR family transcriptional regulator
MTVLEQLTQTATRSGFLSTLPRDAARRLLVDTIRISVPAGALISRDDESPRVIVVISGLLRVFLHSPEGRQVTVRYARSGDVAGLPFALGWPAATSVQAVTSTSVAAVRADTLRSLLASDAGVGRACAEEMARQLGRALDDLSEQAFLPVRRRLIRHLLDLATVGAGSQLVVSANQQELADAVGSVREVVTRTLRALRDEGSIRTARDRVILVDPVRLSDELAT